MIHIKGLVKRFGDRTVLDGIDLEIPEGKITVIMGGSGSGKSTILKNLVGLLKPDAGEIWIEEKNIVQLSDPEFEEIRKKFGMLFQGGALFNSLTVGENVALPLKEHTDLSGEIIRIIVKIKLELVGLTGFEEFYPHQLSGGMKKRVALARAIALDPKVIFYDEPGSGLDPITAGMIDQLILDLTRKLKITSVVVTHEMKSAFRIADQMVVLHRGKIVAEGSPREIRESGIPYVRQFIHGEPEGPIPFRQSSEAYLKGLLEP